MAVLRTFRFFGRPRVALLVVLAALPLTVFGQAARAQIPGSDYPLTDAVVTGFIASYPAIEKLGETLRQRYGVPQGDDPASGWQAFLAYRDAMGELDSVVTRHGFSGFGDWVQAATAIAVAYAFAQEGGGMDSQMAAAMAEIRNNPDIPAAQKELLLQQFQAQSQMMSSMRPTQANLDAVNAHAAELKALFGN